MITGVNVDQRPSAASPSLFIQTGLVFLYAAFALLIMQAPTLLAWPRHNPVTLIATHVVFLGFGTIVTFGALNQMIPVILGDGTAQQRDTVGTYVLLVPGILLQLLGFALWWPWLIFLGGSGVLAGSVWFTVLYAKPLWHKWHTDFTSRYMLASLVFLLLTELFGVLLAWQLRAAGPFLVANGLVVHMLLGGVGWFTQIIVGVSYKLYPMFTTTRSLPTANERRVFGLLNGGLVLAVVGGWADVVLLLAAGCIVIGAALAFYLADVRQMIKSRLRKTLGPGMMQSAIANFHLIAVFLLAALLGWATLTGNPAISRHVLGRLGVMTGFLFAFGWLGNMILGMLTKIVPMLVWLDVYSARAGDAGVPTLGDMIDNRSLTWGAALYHTGITAGAVAIGLGSIPAIIATGSIAFFGYLVLSVTLFHVWYPAP